MSSSGILLHHDRIAHLIMVTSQLTIDGFEAPVQTPSFMRNTADTSLYFVVSFFFPLENYGLWENVLHYIYVPNNHKAKIISFMNLERKGRDLICFCKMTSLLNIPRVSGSASELALTYRSMPGKEPNDVPSVCSIANMHQKMLGGLGDSSFCKI